MASLRNLHLACRNLILIAAPFKFLLKCFLIFIQFLFLRLSISLVGIWSLWILCTAQIQVKGCILFCKLLHEREVSKNYYIPLWSQHKVQGDGWRLCQISSPSKHCDLPQRGRAVPSQDRGGWQHIQLHSWAWDFLPCGCSAARRGGWFVGVVWAKKMRLYSRQPVLCGSGEGAEACNVLSLLMHL